MPRYRVSIPMWAAAYGEVEADSAEEAIENFSLPQICSQCSGWGSPNGEALELSDGPDWDNATAEEV